MIEQATVRAGIDLLSNNFETIMYVYLALFLAFLFFITGLHFIEKSTKEIITSTIKNVTLIFLAVSNVAVLILMGYLYWLNYKKSATPIAFPGEMYADTSWVKSRQQVYFIEDNALKTIKLDGSQLKTVLETKDDIKAYQFSPDGHFMTVISSNELYLLDRKTNTVNRIDSVQQEQSQAQIKGVISGISWAPDSQKFTYELTRWLPYGSTENVYVYDISKRSKKAVKSATRKISSLTWDVDAENLYYLYYEAKDPSFYSYPYEVKIVRISYSTMEPELISQIPVKEASVPIEKLFTREIELFLDSGKLSFRKGDKQERHRADNGSIIGIDDEDHFFLVKGRWFRKRLFKVPRQETVSDLPRFQYRGGDLTIEQMSWLPGGKYVLLFHKDYGPIILEPLTRHLGLFIKVNGDTIGWYQ